MRYKSDFFTKAHQESGCPCFYIIYIVFPWYFQQIVQTEMKYNRYGIISGPQKGYCVEGRDSNKDLLKSFPFPSSPIVGFEVSGVASATRVFLTTFPGVVADSAASLARWEINSYQGKCSFYDYADPMYPKNTYLFKNTVGIPVCML